jgi:hypothetical protein
MATLKLDPALYERAKQAAEATGYSGVDEFVAHCIERELDRLKLDDAEQQVAERLRGLGYLE